MSDPSTFLFKGSERRKLYARIQRRHRSLVTARSKQPGATYPDYIFTPAGEIAASLQITPELVVETIVECGYWMIVREEAGKPKSEWLIEEDGE